MNPTPPPLPNQPSLLHAICGPLLLTTLGILLAIDHVGHMSFGRTWPILLIVFGICRLAEFAGSRNR